MITVTQYFHYPNNTELGKGNTHECYLLVPNSYDLSHIFPDGKEVEVTDVSNKKKYYLRSAWGREFRINQMGQFYRDYDVHMGDEIILTFVEGEDSRTYISVHRHNRLVIKQGRNGAEIINLERLTSYKHGEIYEIPIVWAEQELTLQIQYKEAIAKRSDSPDLTDYYTVKLGNNILQNGSFFLTLGSKNELTTFEKTDMRVFPFDESIISNSTILKRKTITNPSEVITSTSYLPYLTALRTKPFMLLAGISGTGKSRIVRELAFKSCPSYLQDEDGTTPGNYCMIEVKPNWHDSSELLGYYSNITKNYQFTKFVKFLVKAMMFPKVPFFVCMDEMNLAPVEQYFAEFLSVLETRKKNKETDAIQSGVLVDSTYFSDYGLTGCKNNGEVYMKLHKTGLDNIEAKESDSKSLIEKGLTFPDNVFIIGTVNMDDTTHQFSRKVIDRAMTIEMNGEDLTKMFDSANNLEYLPDGQEWELALFQSKYISADEVLNAHADEADTLKKQLTERLTAINNELKDTPFVVSYRVLNELIIYASVLLDDGKSLQEAVDTAVDRITLMKILPRIEGDEDMLGLATDENNRLCKLMPLVGEESQKKLKEMNNRLKTGFTRFWP